MSWEAAWKLLEPLTTWPPIRLQKIKALYQLGREAQGGAIVELGAGQGIGAVALACGARDGNKVRVCTVDPYREVPADRDVFHRNLERAGLEIELIERDLRDLAGTWAEPIALLVWDQHGVDSLLADFAAWQKHVMPRGVFAAKVPAAAYRFPPIAGWSEGRVYPHGLVHTRRKQPVRRRTAFWLMHGARFLQEAIVSATSLARAMPELERVVFQVDRLTNRWYVDQLAFLVNQALPRLGDEVLWLDSDTYLIDPAPELFDVLADHDIAAAHAPGRQTAPTVTSIPDCFPEFNIGVIPMRNTPAVRGFWSRVHEQLVTHPEVYGDNDQAPFRETLWHDGTLKVATLPPEYNCRFEFGTFVRGRVKVLHGRGNYEQVAASLNSGTGMRLWQDRAPALGPRPQPASRPAAGPNFPLNALLASLTPFRAILVTGPQRSGTTIGARIVAQELGLTHVDEAEINVDDERLARQVLARDGVVLQAPGLCHVAHTFGVPVVLMRRPVHEVEASQRRIEWTYEKAELKKYGLESLPEGKIAALKYYIWDSVQKDQCLSFDLEYHSLAWHPLWIDEEGRQSFGQRQWSATH